jgi:glutathione synthase/RimK-type ligase-like ATP-grasp enzyme
VVIRSTWDYQNSPDHFLQVLAEIDNSSTFLFNPLRICRWNLDKVYLRELESQGIPIVPTQWLDSLDEAKLWKAFGDLDVPQVVVKPTVGANADDTFVLEHADQRPWQAALAVFRTKPLMLQPFIQSVVEEGEYSLFYFGGRYSHAILKQPKRGDFRVQEEHGGSIRPIIADHSLTRVAEQVINTLDEQLLYARVDLVRLDHGQPVLTELELIEPSLYFSEDPASPQRFAETLDRFASAACS